MGLGSKTKWEANELYTLDTLLNLSEPSFFISITRLWCIQIAREITWEQSKVFNNWIYLQVFHLFFPKVYKIHPMELIIKEWISKNIANIVIAPIRCNTPSWMASRRVWTSDTTSTSLQKIAKSDVVIIKNKCKI